MLEGKNVLVVERQFLIAIDIQRVLEEAGGGAIALAHSVGQARSLVGGQPEPQLAIVELGPDMPCAADLCAEFASRGLPLILLASGPLDGETLTLDAPVVIKPFGERQLLEACAAALAERVG